MAAQVGAKAVEQKVPAAVATATAETTAVVAASTEMALVAASAGYVKLCAVVAAEASSEVARDTPARRLHLRSTHLPHSQTSLDQGDYPRCVSKRWHPRAQAALLRRQKRLLLTQGSTPRVARSSSSHLPLFRLRICLGCAFFRIAFSPIRGRSLGWPFGARSGAGLDRSVRRCHCATISFSDLLVLCGLIRRP